MHEAAAQPGASGEASAGCSNVVSEQASEESSNMPQTSTETRQDAQERYRSFVLSC